MIFRELLVSCRGKRPWRIDLKKGEPIMTHKDAARVLKHWESWDSVRLPGHNVTALELLEPENARHEGVAIAGLHRASGASSGAVKNKYTALLGGAFDFTAARESAYAGGRTRRSRTAALCRPYPFRRCTGRWAGTPESRRPARGSLRDPAGAAVLHSRTS